MMADGDSDSVTRPRAIRQFERLYFWGWLTGAGASLFWFVESLEGIARSPVLGQGMIPVLFLVTLVGLLIPYALMHFVAHRGSIVAKWLLVLHVGVTSVVVAMSVLGWNGANGGLTMITAAAAIARLASIRYLYTQDARAWFGSQAGARAQATATDEGAPGATP